MKGIIESGPRMIFRGSLGEAGREVGGADDGFVCWLDGWKEEADGLREELKVGLLFSSIT